MWWWTVAGSYYVTVQVTMEDTEAVKAYTAKEAESIALQRVKDRFNFRYANSYDAAVVKIEKAEGPEAL